jgi:hypothetical protein
MAASAAFQISGSLAIPPDAGQPNAPLPFSGSGSYSSKVEHILNLVGAATHSLGMGTVISPGAKVVLIEVDASSTAAPINLRWNGGGSSGQMEIAPGGFFAVHNPSPVAGLTALDIVHTTENTVRITVLM